MQSAPFSRRALLRACVRASLVSAFALAAGLPLAAQAEEVLRVSAIPDEAPTELQRKFAPLGAYLEAETGMKVSFVPVTDYAAVVEALATRKITRHCSTRIARDHCDGFCGNITGLYITTWT
mgnify:CR=1 FL=1